MEAQEPRLRELARERGLDDLGVARVDPALERVAHARYEAWLEEGYAAGMSYLHGRGADRRRSVQTIVPGARSVVVVLRSFHHPVPPFRPGEARISRYALGPDYHRQMERDLKALTRMLAIAYPGGQHRWYVDTGPVLERFWAQQAGLAWIGKHTGAIHPDLGCSCFLGVILTTAELAAGAPLEDRCGTCNRCLEACPTGALVAPRILDATRCLAYWTIEHRGPLPRHVATALADQLFGCDRCQEVCPHERKVRPPRDDALAPREQLRERDPVRLAHLLLSAPDELLRGSPLRRAGRQGLLRNLATLLGTRPSPAARETLAELSRDPDAVVAEAARQALQRG